MTLCLLNLWARGCEGCQVKGQRAKGKSEGKGVGPGFRFEGYALGCKALSAVVYQTP